jgi:thiol-disulfide isomerase/thioredoxin
LKLSDSIAAILLSFFLPFYLFAGNTVIEGTAPEYSGKKITLLKYQEYISFSLETVSETTISESGNFKFDLDSTGSFEAILQIDDVRGLMYIQPEATYKIMFPKEHFRPGFGKTLQNNYVQLVFEDLSKDDINYLIHDFNYEYDEFIGRNHIYMRHAIFKTYLDSFKIHLKEIYSDVNDIYFLDYVKYGIAGLEQIAIDRRGDVKGDPALNRLFIYNDYIINRPVRYNNNEYMVFFDQFYKRNFKLADFLDPIIDAINNKASYAAIMKILERDIYLKMDRVRELVLIKGLAEVYYDPTYLPTNVLYILDTVMRNSKYDEHRTITNNMINKLTKLDIGFEAPEFKLKDQRDSLITIEKYRGKFVYLDFWATWCKPCVTEMGLIPELKEKYGKYIEFVSINIDSDPAKMQQFLKTHPKLKWNFTHFSDDPSVKEKYDIRALPAYFLIDPDGDIYQAPAYTPSPNGTFKSIANTFADIKRKMDTDKGWQVGDKGNNTPRGGRD